MQVLKSDAGASFALARVPASEVKGNFACRLDPPAHEDFQQELEAFRFKIKAINRLTPNDEESRHGILDANVLALERKRGKRACA